MPRNAAHLTLFAADDLATPAEDELDLLIARLEDLGHPHTVRRVPRSSMAPAVEQALLASQSVLLIVGEAQMLASLELRLSTAQGVTDRVLFVPFSRLWRAQGSTVIDALLARLAPSSDTFKPQMRTPQAMPA